MCGKGTFRLPHPSRLFSPICTIFYLFSPLVAESSVLLKYPNYTFSPIIGLRFLNYL